MSAPFLTTTSTVVCPHFGNALLTTSNTQALVDNSPILLLTDLHTIAGCLAGAECLMSFF